MIVIYFLILFFVFGAVMGSFYNVVSYRLSNDLSIVNPKRSYCPNCNHQLSSKDLVPIFSYLVLKGKCRYCSNKISIFYPIVELFTGLLFSVCYYSFGFSFDLIISLTLVSLLSIVIFSDLNYYIIPDQASIFCGIIIFIANIFRFGFLGSLKYLLYGFIMFMFMYLLMLFGNFLFKKETLGGGDIKLLFVLGMTVPLIYSFFGVVLATFLALPVAIFLFIFKKDKVVPFGPFLIISFLLLFFFKLDDPSLLYNYFL